MKYTLFSSCRLRWGLSSAVQLFLSFSAHFISCHVDQNHVALSPPIRQPIRLRDLTGEYETPQPGVPAPFSFQLSFLGLPQAVVVSSSQPELLPSVVPAGGWGRSQPCETSPASLEETPGTSELLLQKHPRHNQTIPGLHRCINH